MASFGHLARAASVVPNLAGWAFTNPLIAILASRHTLFLKIGFVAFFAMQLRLEKPAENGFRTKVNGE